MTIAAEPVSKAAPAVKPGGLELPTSPRPYAAFGTAAAALPEYLVDAFQRSVLFLDLLRRRGDEEVEITSRPMATVLSFGHDVLMDGRSLPRPINYTLSRIVPPPGVAIDRRKRPVVVVDPRAGQGPGSVVSRRRARSAMPSVPAIRSISSASGRCPRPASSSSTSSRGR